MMISIVVPTLNEAEHIEATLARLVPLRRAGAEIIVVDGGSTDGTGELATGRCDRVLTARKGRAAQMNAGAAVAGGEILWFLHADTRVPDDAPAQIRGALASGRTWGRFDVRLSGQAPVLRLVERLMNRRSRLTGIATGDQGIFVRADVFHGVGGFPDQPLMEDVELSRRLRRTGRPACPGGPLVTSSRRWEAEGPWCTIALMWWLRLAYFLGASPESLHRRYYGTDPQARGDGR